MARRFILEVRKAPYSPKAPYLVHVPKSLHAAEGAQRRFFEKEAIARAYVKRLAKMLGEYQLQALGLNDEQKVEAARCYRLLEKYDAGLLTAVQHYIAYLEEANASVPVSQLLELFLETKKQDGISHKYLADLRSKLGRFVAAFPEKLACDLTTAELEVWIRGLNIGAVSRESYRRNIGVMLEFGRRRKLLRENPAADIKIARRPEGEVTILTATEVRRLLQVCSTRHRALYRHLRLCRTSPDRGRESGLERHPPGYRSNRSESPALQDEASSAGANTAESRRMAHRVSESFWSSGVFAPEVPRCLFEGWVCRMAT